MAGAKSEKRRLMLEAGSEVILHPDGPAGGYPRSFTVDRVADGQHWFLGSCEPLRRGEALIVEYPVPQDARYVTSARIEACSDEIFALKIDDLWDRAQQREFVRISAHGLEVRVVRSFLSGSEVSEEGVGERDEAAQMGVVYPLLDISAGGIRFQTRADFETDEEVICHFELPGSACFVLPARVVRGQPGNLEHVPKPEIAVEFRHLAEEQRTELLRWVYREQISRHRMDKDQRKTWFRG